MTGRPARALLGWMTPEEATLVQAGRQADRAAEPEFVQKAEHARAAVAARPTGVNQTDLLAPAASMSSYGEELSTNPVAAAMFNEGWTISVADISRVVAIQPTVFTDAAEDRVQGADGSDLASVAAISLPLPVQKELPVQFDQVKQAWVAVSRNPNLRIVGNWGGEVQPGIVGFGFIVQLSPSLMQVASFRGRYFLRDGYHRAYGLLKLGVTHVPVFTRDFPSFESIGLNPGMLPQDAYLGERPPLLTDYHDDTVAVDVMLPAAQKMVVIQGFELTPFA